MKIITEDEWYKLSREKQNKFTGIIKYYDGTLEYRKNGLLHRDYGPAVETKSGYKEYFKHNKLHRLNGPARIWPGVREEYWINGKHLTKLEWLRQTPMFQDVLKYKELR